MAATAMATSEPFLRSGFYRGHTTHTRGPPLAHAFTYNLMMAYVDLAEAEAGALDAWPALSTTTAAAAAAFLPTDHARWAAPAAATAAAAAATEAPSGGCPSSSRSPPRLSDIIREAVAAATGAPPPAGRIGCLTTLRVAGAVFNPVSFFYVWGDGTARGGATREVVALLVEVGNIPWLEQHPYVVLPTGGAGSSCGGFGDGGGARLRAYVPTTKAFHVSPFFPIDGLTYGWAIADPTPDSIALRITLHETPPLATAPEVGTTAVGSAAAARVPLSTTGNASTIPLPPPVFTATLDLRYFAPLTAAATLRVVAAAPAAPWRVMAAIHAHAAGLYFGRSARFYPHPGSATAVTGGASGGGGVVVVVESVAAAYGGA
ncbi:hypothetical protein MMPV_003695 [Pyropia vietnamensis]